MKTKLESDTGSNPPACSPSLTPETSKAWDDVSRTPDGMYDSSVNIREYAYAMLDHSRKMERQRNALLKQLTPKPKMNSDTTQIPARCVHPACSALLELAIRWLAEADIHDADGAADCGTGADVPYACASKCREHAAELEMIVYAIASPNVPDETREH